MRFLGARTSVATSTTERLWVALKRPVCAASARGLGLALSHDLPDDLALPRLVVELEEGDLLPRPEGGMAVDNRQREARSEEGGADMAMAVPIVPPALVAVLDRRREEPFQRVRDILLHESRLELVRHDGTRGRWREDAREAIADSGRFDYVRNAVRDVDRLRSLARLERNRLPVSDHGDGIPPPRKNVGGASRSRPRSRVLPVDRPSTPGKKEVARAAPRLAAEIARSPRGWALVGGRIVEPVSAEADEAVVVEGDRPHLPGRLDRLRRLHLDVDRVVVLLLDLLRRVLDFLGEGREVRLRQVVDDPLDDRDDHVANDLHRFVEGHLVGEPIQRIVLHDDHAVRFATELLEPLSSGFGPALDFERQDRDADHHGPVRARGPSDDGCGSGARGAPEARDDEDDV